MSRAPSDVRVTSVDVPFLSLTWFFVKASFALGLAFALTSWIWVLLGTGALTLVAALLVGLGVPSWFDGWMVPSAPATPQVVVVPAAAPAPVAPPPAPAPAEAADTPEEGTEPEHEPEPGPAVDNPPADHEGATHEAMRAELERARRERGRH